MTVLVLDDDPTGTQCASDVSVLLRPYETGPWTTGYVLTNTRALDADDAAALVTSVKERAGPGTELVLRGDSTLRGHVFAEMNALGLENGVGLIVPAFPAAGRITVGGVHFVDTGDKGNGGNGGGNGSSSGGNGGGNGSSSGGGSSSGSGNGGGSSSGSSNGGSSSSGSSNGGSSSSGSSSSGNGGGNGGGTRINVADTEFARDPVFGFTARTMRDWVTELGGPRPYASVGPSGVREALLRLPNGGVVVPDVTDDADLIPILAGLTAARQAGRHVVVRCAAPLAALLAGVTGRLVPAPKPARPGLLIVCGSHTAAATAQLAALAAHTPPHLVVPTDAPGTSAATRARATRTSTDALVEVARRQLREAGVAVVTTERVRRAEHGTLADGARVMAALTGVVARLAPYVGMVVTKGGITSAEVATSGLGASVATVRGQVETGVPLWDVGGVPVAVVPGNIGDAGTLVRMMRYFTGGRGPTSTLPPM
ncbi:four-carbon acid sugar kinase family protein [Paractinoplanes lichenicola]|uniref:Four-carbon acid sugar kinase family protein n=1 Tax=Paractinoplanes lichenicola TaxID=2802976 RepID=A0ABS1VFZ2_9ACTN|nr:four-carbon acid sugar kinase family protein [Actinoplanes lichenicola]MBL7253245.1 hypothetical protein [Actinoplanes lichenicola]